MKSDCAISRFVRPSRPAGRSALAGRDGRTNREIAQSLFITRKTVEMHLHNAYRKLDIDSRAGLPDALTQEAGQVELAPER